MIHESHRQRLLRLGEPEDRIFLVGSPALDTIALYMMRLKPRVKTAPYRTTDNNVYAVVKGTGTTTVDGERFEWSRGDVIAAPALVASRSTSAAGKRAVGSGG